MYINKHIFLFAALEENLYFEAGKMIAVSLVHGGPSPGFFSKTLFKCLVYGPENVKPALEDVADDDVAQTIKKVICNKFHSISYSQIKDLLNINFVEIKKLIFHIYVYRHLVNKCLTYLFMQIKYANSLSSLQSTLQDCCEFLAAAGCLRPVTALCDKNMLVNDILICHVIKRVTLPLERFVLLEFLNFLVLFLTATLNNRLLKLTFTCSCLFSPFKPLKCGLKCTVIFS